MKEISRLEYLTSTTIMYIQVNGSAGHFYSEDIVLTCMETYRRPLWTGRVVTYSTESDGNSTSTI